jgi:hypothetical protein
VAKSLGNSTSQSGNFAATLAALFVLSASLTSVIIRRALTDFFSTSLFEESLILISIISLKIL